MHKANKRQSFSAKRSDLTHWSNRSLLEVLSLGPVWGHGDRHVLGRSKWNYLFEDISPALKKEESTSHRPVVEDNADCISNSHWPGSGSAEVPLYTRSPENTLAAAQRLRDLYESRHEVAGVGLKHHSKGHPSTSRARHDLRRHIHDKPFGCPFCPNERKRDFSRYDKLVHHIYESHQDKRHEFSAITKMTLLAAKTIPVYDETLTRDAYIRGKHAKIDPVERTSAASKGIVTTVHDQKTQFGIPEAERERLLSDFSNELVSRLRSMSLNLSPICSDTHEAIVSILGDFVITSKPRARCYQEKLAIHFVQYYRIPIANLIKATFNDPHPDAGVKIKVEKDSQGAEHCGLSRICRKGSCSPDIVTFPERMHHFFGNMSISSGAAGMRGTVPRQKGMETTEYLVSSGSSGEQKEPVVSEAMEGQNLTSKYYSEALTNLTKGHDYQWLLGRLKSELLLTNRQNTVAEEIRIMIQQRLAALKLEHEHWPAECQANFEFFWSLRGFLREHYPSEAKPELSSLITITGSGFDAQATTCGEYMRQVWPTTGLETLRALQEALRTKAEDEESTYSTANGTRIKIDIREDTVIAVVAGTQLSIAEVGQQLAWLGAALRGSPASDTMAYSKPRIYLFARSPPTFDVFFDVIVAEPYLSDSQISGSCWRPLFRNPIVVQGFPILARHNEEKGLELPINMMAGLGEASQISDFDGGHLIKGFSTLFYPVKRLRDSVLWHFLRKEDGSRMTYPSHDCITRAGTAEVDFGCLEQSRTFLGWTPEAECHTGSQDVKYTNITWPGSNLASAGVDVEKVSLVAGQYISGGVSFLKGTQDTLIYLSKINCPYATIIHSAYNMSVVLYDTKDRRGWLVDGASALLHLTRTQLSSSPYSDSDLFNLNEFDHMMPDAGKGGAKRVLMSPKNRSLVIFQDTRESSQSNSQALNLTSRWTYQDLVLQTCLNLERINDYQTKRLASPTVGIHLTTREKIIGFSFMDIVDGQNMLLPLVEPLTSNGRGWVDFIRSIPSVTLFGRGFGEIIKPAKESNHLCKRCTRVPTGKEYLVACTSTLFEICKRRGDCESDPLKLVDGVYWRTPDKLYDACDHAGSAQHVILDRVQILVPHSFTIKKNTLPFESPNGAVIFGSKSRRFRLRWLGKGEPEEDASYDSKDDEGFDFQDSGIGESLPSTSDQDSPTDPGQSPSSASTSSSTNGEASMIGALPMTDNVNNATPCEEAVAITVNRSIYHKVPEPHQKPGNLQLHGPRVVPVPGAIDNGTLKRTWDKVKEQAPKLLPRKRVETGNSSTEQSPNFE